MAEIQGKSSSGGYIVGILVLAAAIGAIVYFSSTKDGSSTPTTTATQAAPTPPEPPHNAPPPPAPPRADDIAAELSADASSSAAPALSGHLPQTSNSNAVAMGPVGGCSKCGSGKGSSALSSAVSSVMGSAQGCYNRALKNSASSGSMNVALQIGPKGEVCGASITNDTVGNPEISNCVLQRFSGRSYPPPEEGCVIVNAPIKFQIAGQ